MHYQIISLTLDLWRKRKEREKNRKNLNTFECGCDVANYKSIKESAKKKVTKEKIVVIDVYIIRLKKHDSTS